MGKDLRKNTGQNESQGFRPREFTGKSKPIEWKQNKELLPRKPSGGHTGWCIVKGDGHSLCVMWSSDKKSRAHWEDTESIFKGQKVSRVALKTPQWVCCFLQWYEISCLYSKSHCALAWMFCFFFSAVASYIVIVCCGVNAEFKGHGLGSPGR